MLHLQGCFFLFLLVLYIILLDLQFCRKVLPIQLSKFPILKMEEIGVYLGPKSTSLNFSLNLLIRFFWICTWWQALINFLKWLFWIFIENSNYAKNGGKFFASKIIVFELFSKPLFFSEIVLDDQYGKMGKNENSCYAQIWEMCQMLEPGVHCYFVRVVYLKKKLYEKVAHR